MTVGFLAALGWLTIDVWRVRTGDDDTLIASATLVLIYVLAVLWRSFRSKPD